jgi:hypothetical protein
MENLVVAHPDLPAIVYKYANQTAAPLIIANATLRVGRPTDMNDPFDGYIDDLFDDELKERYHDAGAKLIEFLERDPAEFANRIGVPLGAAIAASQKISAGTDAQRQELLTLTTSAAVEQMYPELKALRATLEVQRAAMVAQFRDSGIFCATRRKDNLLMWAHYAENHRGVVIGFRPDAARDSFLCLLEPVIYSDTRPSFYKPFDPLSGNRVPKPEDMRAFTQSLTAVKGTEWAYEEELRLVIPSYVPPGRDAVFIPFYPSELAELYLGHRVSPEFRRDICAAARTLNRDVAIFQAQLARERYALEFDPVE